MYICILRSSDQLLYIHISYDTMYNNIIIHVCIFVCNNTRGSLNCIVVSPSLILIIISFITYFLPLTRIRDYRTAISLYGRYYIYIYILYGRPYIIIIVISQLHALYSCVKKYFPFYYCKVSHNMYTYIIDVFNVCRDRLANMV